MSSGEPASLPSLHTLTHLACASCHMLISTFWCAGKGSEAMDQAAPAATAAATAAEQAAAQAATAQQPGEQPPASSPNAVEDDEDDDDENETCGFCRFMKGGGCRSAFIVSWAQGGGGCVARTESQACLSVRVCTVLLGKLHAWNC